MISTSRALAIRLAELANSIRKRALARLAVESEHGPLRRLHAALREALIQDLDEEAFADSYAQTIAYGLFSAGISSPAGLRADDIAHRVVLTNPFLKELLESFLTAGGRRSTIDLDELGITEVVEVLRQANREAVLRDSGARNPQEDPVLHFYECFLRAYDPRKRIQRGVFYTPRPVVSFMIRSVHELLQKEFGLIDGLADTVTWGQMEARYPGMIRPANAGPEDAFVQILDPATGTGTFLVEAIDLIYKTMRTKWIQAGHREQEVPELWNEYVPKSLLPRLYGYELMLAPYTIAHLKIGLKLHETGYCFRSKERVRVYLTNTLEPPQDIAGCLSVDIPAFVHEAQAVKDVKRRQRFTIVVGNPPYSGFSANMSGAMMSLVGPYKCLDGVSLRERKIWAQDDYKKFIRFAHNTIHESNAGMIGLITNHGFLGEPTSRGMRDNLLADFSRISVLDLHGSLKKREVCPDGSPDKNIFDIEPGVAISFLRRSGVDQTNVTHSEMWGLREKKYDDLQNHTVGSVPCTQIEPSSEFYLFVPHNEATKAEFSQCVRLVDIFQSGSNGIQTSRDHIVYGFTPAECRQTIAAFRAPDESLSTKALRDKYWPNKKVGNYAPGDTRGWRLSDARDHLRRDRQWETHFRPALYRPFDFRTLFYSGSMIDWPRTPVMSQMLRPNLSLCVGRAGSAADNQEWNVVFVADRLVDMNLFYRGGNVNYPLRFAALSGSFDIDRSQRPNFKAGFLKRLGQTLERLPKRDANFPEGITPEEIFQYIYAVFHSPGYRKRYADFLKIDFPRLPLTRNLGLFRALARLGGELVAFHLVNAPMQAGISLSLPDKAIGTFRYAQPPILRLRYQGPHKPVVQKLYWSANTVWLNTDQSACFHGVPEKVWKFHIGGHQVCAKWLKDRKGRILSADDLLHYHRIVIALHETIRLMAEIDRVIDQHGGWPKAFLGDQESTAACGSES
jgi:predicted helicase